MDEKENQSNELNQTGFETTRNYEEVDFIEIPQRGTNSLVLFNFKKRERKPIDKQKPAA